jgi:hypothetical protein
LGGSIGAITPAQHRLGKRGALCFRELQGVGEGTDGVRVGSLSLAALEGADGLGCETGSRG